MYCFLNNIAKIIRGHSVLHMSSLLAPTAHTFLLGQLVRLSEDKSSFVPFRLSHCTLRKERIYQPPAFVASHTTRTVLAQMS